MRDIRIVFDGPPGPGRTSGRFVEVEDADGKGIALGEWREIGNGKWALYLPDPLERVPARGATMMQRKQWRQDGIDAFRAGKSQAHCPYDGRTTEGREWLSGWRDAANRTKETS